MKRNGSDHDYFLCHPENALYDPKQLRDPAADEPGRRGGIHQPRLHADEDLLEGNLSAYDVRCIFRPDLKLDHNHPGAEFLGYPLYRKNRNHERVRVYRGFQK